MASLKRYKLPSDYSAVNRSPEIPPRFKRQKSLTQKQHTSMESSNQNANPTHKHKKSQWSETPSTASHHKGSSFPREGRKIVKRLFTTENEKAQSNGEKNLLKPQQTSSTVLSPVENKLFKFLRNANDSDNAWSPESGFCSDSSDTQMLGSPAGSAATRQTSPCDSSFHSRNLLTTPVYNVPYFGENHPSSPGSFERPQSISPYHVTNETPVNDYTDPDVRTIEMLRELERVADATDVGSEENCNDKNSLVSHHLRMLMCAVDRYTQGVDDEGIGSDSEVNDHDDSLNENQPAESRPVPGGTMNMWDPWSSASFNGLDVYCIDKPVSPMFLNDNVSTFYARH